MKEVFRCPWCLKFEQYIQYHDEEWGVPVYDDRRHFEFLILEGAQAGLSWSTILNKREGYQKAFGAIFDGNITAIATSVILFYFGTGPIRGFATTLILGLIASMFTAIFFTRIIVDTLVLKWGFNRLNIGLKEDVVAHQAVRA